MVEGEPADLIRAHDDPWEWLQRGRGWMKLVESESDRIEQALSLRKFLKISKFIDLEDYQQFPDRVVQSWQEVHTLWQ